MYLLFIFSYSSCSSVNLIFRELSQFLTKSTLCLPGTVSLLKQEFHLVPAGIMGLVLEGSLQIVLIKGITATNSEAHIVK